MTSFTAQSGHFTAINRDLSLSTVFCVPPWLYLLYNFYQNSSQNKWRSETVSSFSRANRSPGGRGVSCDTSGAEGQGGAGGKPPAVTKPGIGFIDSGLF